MNRPNEFGFVPNKPKSEGEEITKKEGWGEENKEDREEKQGQEGGVMMKEKEGGELGGELGGGGGGGGGEKMREDGKVKTD